MLLCVVMLILLWCKVYYFCNSFGFVCLLLFLLLFYVLWGFSKLCVGWMGVMWYCVGVVLMLCWNVFVDVMKVYNVVYFVCIVV